MYMEGFLTREWDLVVLGCRWFLEHQLISDQRMGVGLFHTVRGCVDLRDHRFSPRLVGVIDLCMEV